MAKLKEVCVLSVLALVFVTGMACSAAPLIGQGQSSLGFTKFGIGVLFRSF